MSNKLKLGILGSGKGSNFIAIAESIAKSDLDAEILIVGSDKVDVGIIKEAKLRQLRTFVCPQSKFKTKLEPEIEQALANKLKSAGCEWIVLAGYMRVVKQPLLDAFPHRIINIHPSLLPRFPGLQAWKQALDAGCCETGCTVHLVNEIIDGGDILAQARVPVLPVDTAESLHARIQVAEHKLLPEVLKKISLGLITLPSSPA